LRWFAVAGTPFIAMTASALQDDPERCFEAGMDDFMSKPLRLSQLTRLLRRWLAGGDEAGRGGNADGDGNGGEKKREAEAERLSWINYSDAFLAR
jgi:DNA-binding response OmpR family regulator